ncbi:MAG: 3-isopropylmalate dehydratase small subunit [Rhodospirillales bacterium]|nr:3-isopropylmalate dehydratase small subunit [Rhodospirillales bacterium]
MEPFNILTAPAMPMAESNVDTDQICPARYIKTLIGPTNDQALFHDRRFDEAGTPKADFVFNDPRYKDAQIIVGQRNFGVGSSREAAVFALQSCGFRAIIAESFGDIFANNCFKNGVLPIKLETEESSRLQDSVVAHAGVPLVIDLPAQKIIGPDGAEYEFSIGALHKMCLLEGLDDLSLTERYLNDITAFEEDYWAALPWLRS